MMDIIVDISEPEFSFQLVGYNPQPVGQPLTGVFEEPEPLPTGVTVVTDKEQILALRAAMEAEDDSR